MLITKSHNRYQLSDQNLAEHWSSRGTRQTTKAVASSLLCLSFIIFNKPCFAFETHHVAKTSSVTSHQKPDARVVSKLQDTLWWQIAKHHQLDPYILYAVALVESAKDSAPNHVTPWPWAINKSGKSIIPASHQEARTALNKALAEGGKHIDVGLMQINLHWHGHRVDKPEQLLNPVTNLQIGALLLAEAIQSVPNDLVLGIGRYHSWQNVDAAVTYGRRVLAVADQIRTVL